eukprot:744252_1
MDFQEVMIDIGQKEVEIRKRSLEAAHDREAIHIKKRRLDKLVDECSADQQKLTALRSESEHDRAQLGILGAQIGTVEARVGGALVQKDILESHVEAKDKMIAAERQVLKSENEACQTRVNVLSVELTDKTRPLMEQLKELQETEDKLKHIVMIHSSTNAFEKDGEKEEKQLLNEMASLEAELAKIQAENCAFLEKQTSLNAKILELNGEVSEIETEKKNMTKERDEMDVKFKNISSTVKSPTPKPDDAGPTPPPSQPIDNPLEAMNADLVAAKSDFEEMKRLQRARWRCTTRPKIYSNV